MNLFMSDSFWMLIVTCMIPFLARLFIRNVFRKNIKQKIPRAKTLSFYANDMLTFFNVEDIQILTGIGRFIDKYDHQHAQLIISENSNGLAALAVLLHECGHVVQGAHGQLAYQTIKTLKRIINGVAWLTIPLLVIAIVFLKSVFALISLYIFIVILVYNVFCLALELNANGYVKMVASEHEYIDKEDMKAFQTLLFATSLSSLASIFQVFSILFKLIVRAIVGPTRISSNNESIRVK